MKNCVNFMIMFFVTAGILAAVPVHSSAAANLLLLDDAQRTKFGIYNDGTHPAETAKGLNNALQFAHRNGFTMVEVPNGTYLIDKNSQINMVSNMTFLLDSGTIIKKETNGYEIYNTIYVGPGTENATIKGGMLLGDRDTHDYSKTQYPWTSGTHEWGTGINITGGRNITVEDMRIQKFTGDGIEIGGSTMSGGGTLTSASFESGGLDNYGQPIAEAGKIRSIANSPITNFSRIKDDLHRIVELWLPKGLSSKDFGVCYYRKDNSFIRCDSGRIYTKYSMAPKDADHFRLVLNAQSTTGAEVQWMVIEDAKGVVIQNNDIGYNRRQGITAGGEDVQILNNKIHDTQGTAPQSGIDIEPGYFPAMNHTIKGNTFLNNKIQMVLCWGTNVKVDSNHFELTDAVRGGEGLYIYPMYQGASVSNNTFKGTGMSVGPDKAVIEKNHFINASATLNGTNQILRNSDFLDSSLSIGNKTNQGVENITITNSGNDPKNNAGLSVWANPVSVKNVKLFGTPDHKATIGGYTSNKSVFDHLQMVNGQTGTTGFPSGTYKNCTFTYTGEKTSSLSIQYNADVTIDHSVFHNATLGVFTQTAKANIQNNQFSYDGELSAPSVYVTAAQNVTLLNNRFDAMHLTNINDYIIKLGQYAWKTHQAKISGASVVSNVVKSNIPVKGIDTLDEGTGGVKFVIQNNQLTGAKLQLKSLDITTNNKVTSASSYPLSK